MKKTIKDNLPEKEKKENLSNEKIKKPIIPLSNDGTVVVDDSNTLPI